MNIIGRRKEIKKITRYATCDPDNKAFLGVKGIGKSSIIQQVLSSRNCRAYAEDYHYLFVKAILKAEKKGDDLINFLLDRVIDAVDLIDDETIKNRILDRLSSAEKKYHTKESLLSDALETVKQEDYSLILVMDDFHNMGRNSSVGSDQYEFLRSLSNNGLVYYWVISDSDFSDAYATQQFKTSFFVQNFIYETIPQMNREDVYQLLEEKADDYDLVLSDEIKEGIYSVIGGIPAFVVPAIQCIESMNIQDNSQFIREAFIENMLENERCLSYFNSWSRSLKKEQKYILLDIARKTKIYQDEIATIREQIKHLGDRSGLGLLIHDSDENGDYWTININLYQEYILTKEDTFLTEDVTIIESQNSETEQSRTTYIQNNYFTVNNNFFNPDDAVKSLLILKEMATSKRLALPDKTVTDAIQCLPYEQSGWDKLSEEEKDEQMDGYADTIFASGQFKADTLSETQLSRFSLTQPFLDSLSDSSRDNLISAIQVYDLLQFCVDRFGLNILNSESARGILFARLYESMLKENFYPALCSISDISVKPIKLGINQYTVSSVPPYQMTIKYFAKVLYDRNVRNKLATICISQIDRSINDFSWWTRHQDDMFHIGDLRNECCHSGNVFTGQKLEALLHYLFDLHAITNIEVYNAITNRT